MMNRFSLDRFKKAQSDEPFHVSGATPSHSVAKSNPSPSPGAGFVAPTLRPSSSLWLAASTTAINTANTNTSFSSSSGSAATAAPSTSAASATAAASAASALQCKSVGGGASPWQPPAWAVEPRQGVYYLEVIKDGAKVDHVPLDKRRSLFGRQSATCDFVLDHPSLSRQHAVVLHQKNGSVFVVDLGSVHGTFVSNERLKKDIPVELEVGQSLRFAASTRVYVLRKNFKPSVTPSRAATAAPVQIPPPPDPANEEAVVAYHTLLNRHGIYPGQGSEAAENDSRGEKRKRDARESMDGNEGDNVCGHNVEKRKRTKKVRFRDEFGGILVEMVGFSDGLGFSSEPGPVGVKEGVALVGKFDSLVQTTVILKPRNKAGAAKGGEGGGGGMADAAGKAEGVTKSFQEYLDKVKFARQSSLYGSLGETKVEIRPGSWAGGGDVEQREEGLMQKKEESEVKNRIETAEDDEDLDLFGKKSNKA